MTQWQPEYQPRRSAGQPPAVPPQFRQPRQDGTGGRHSYPQPAPPVRQPVQHPAWQPDSQDYWPQQPPPRRRQGSGYGPWIAAGAVVLLAVAGGGYYVLHGRAPAKPLTCKQQYANWKTGPALAGGKKIEADATALSKAGEDIPVVTSGLKAIGADATALQAYPMPQCADPAGYWAQYLTDLKAAGDNAGSASGLGGLILAEAPLKDVKSLQSKLSAEMAKTVGAKPS